MHPVESHAPLSLVLVAALALAVPILLRRLRMHLIPIAVGEILIGIAVGRSGLDLIEPDGLVKTMMFLGLSCLMFLTGMEIDLGSLWPFGHTKAHRTAGERPEARMHRPLVTELGLFVLTLGAVAAVAAGLSLAGLVKEPLFLTLVMTTCGITIIMPVLKDRGLLETDLGRVILHTGVIGDIIPIVVLSVMVSIRRHGSAAEAVWMLLLLMAAAAIYQIGRRLRLTELAGGLTDGTAQVGVRASLALMLLFVGLAESVGTEAILGAFLGGILGRALGGTSLQALSHKLEALSFGFFIPIFFLMVGVEFDLSTVIGSPSSLVLTALILAGTFIAKAVPALLLRLWYPWRETLAGASLLTTQMSVTVAASTVALTAGAYDASVHGAVVLAAMALAVIGPLLFNRILPPAPVAAPRRGVIVTGPGTVVPLLARRLAVLGHAVTVIEPHSPTHPLLGSPGVTHIEGSPTDPECLIRAGARNAMAVAALTGDESLNLQIARRARDEFGVPQAVLFAWSQEALDEAQSMGAAAVNPALTEVALVESLITGGESLRPVVEMGADVAVLDLPVTGGQLEGQTLREANLPGHALVLQIRRGKEKLIPHGSTRLRLGDLVTVMVPVTHLPELTASMARQASPARVSPLGPEAAGSD